MRWPAVAGDLHNQYPMQLRQRVLLSLIVCLAACGDLKVRSVPPAVVVPAELEGRWVGTWESIASEASGDVEIHIQEFASQPLVAVTIDNPCLVPRSYDLRWTAQGIDLLADGVAVFQATRVATQQLVGSYQCEQDEGTWTAQWVESLPALLDLTGTWEGRIFGGGQPDQPIDIAIVQRVQGGALVLDAEADLPGVLPFALPLQGFVRFRESEFELVLQTEPGFEPQMIVSGLGDREPLQMPLGLVQVLSSTVLPFAQGMIELVLADPEE
tara:strand:+ start:4201 stop:5010 length:810 start_codon:yes stop_codon:yes gene_type:complete